MNYDLNIWDKLSYDTDGRVTGTWVINPYVIPDESTGYGTKEMLSKTFWLRDYEVEMLELHKEDDDFWIDQESLMHEKLVPRRLRKWLGGLSHEG